MAKNMYILKTMSGEKFNITEEEFRQLGQVKNGLVFIKSCGSMINTSSISSIYPNDKKNEIENKKELQIGVLHDGTMVRRYFGRWVLYSDQSADDNGNYNPIVIDQKYYPEIAADCVMSTEEFNKVKHLSEKERLALITKKYPQLDRLNSKPEIINKLLKK